jgi:hypothetical protein
MTVFRIDGFETYGDGSLSNADIESRIEDCNETDFFEASGGFSGSKGIVTGYDGEGYSMQWPLFNTSQSEFFAYYYPDGTGRHNDYYNPTNSSSIPMACGIRIYIPDTTDDLSYSYLRILSGTNTSQSLFFIRDSDKVGFDPASGAEYISSSCLTKGQWHYVEAEWKMTSAGQGGYIKMWVDGVSVLDETSVDVSGATFYTSYGVQLGVGQYGGASSPSDSSELTKFDDMYVMAMDNGDTAPLGPVRIKALKPSGDDSVQWTPSTGASNSDIVSRDDLAETSQIDGASLDVDVYDLDDLTGADSVHCVQVMAWAESAALNSIIIGLDNGTSDVDNLGFVPSAGPVARVEGHAVDPSGAAWTPSSVNSVKGRLENS